MASRRKLKKEVINLVASRFEEALLLRAFATEEQAVALEALMDDIMVFTDDTLRRIQHTDGADNRKLVRAYYRKLNSEIEAKIETFDERLTTHLEAL